MAALPPGEAPPPPPPPPPPRADGPFPPRMFITKVVNGGRMPKISAGLSLTVARARRPSTPPWPPTQARFFFFSMYVETSVLGLGPRGLRRGTATRRTPVRKKFGRCGANKFRVGPGTWSNSVSISGLVVVHREAGVVDHLGSVKALPDLGSHGVANSRRQLELPPGWSGPCFRGRSALRMFRGVCPGPRFAFLREVWGEEKPAPASAAGPGASPA